MEKHDKLGNLGALADIALAKHKSTFAMQGAMAGLLNGVFIAFASIVGYLGLAVIWPAVPNFTGNAAITDGIVLGIFSVVFLFIIAFFLMWQSAAIIIICKHHDEAQRDIAAVIRALAKSAAAVLTVLLAQTLIFTPFLAAFALIAAFNFAAILSLAPPMLIVLFVVFTVQRALSVFALNLAIEGKHLFLSAIVQSAKIVLQRGMIRIFATAALITAVNLAVFFGLFFGLLAIFGQFPAGLMDFLMILANPMGVVALLFLAYLIMIFLTPKMPILAHVMHISGDAASRDEAPGLASRSLATALDIAIAAPFFAAFFYGAANLVSGGGFAASQMNTLAATIAIIAFFAVYTIYNIFFEVFNGGQTPAKRAFGLVVRGQGGGALSLVQSLVRNILRIVDIFGFVAIAFNKEHRRLGDILSLAIVEYEGKPRPEESPNVH